MVLNTKAFHHIVQSEYDWDTENDNLQIPLHLLQQDQMDRGRIIYEVVQMGNGNFGIINHWFVEFIDDSFEEFIDASNAGKALCSKNPVNCELIVRKTLLQKNGITEV